jgi:hypothetical protein
MRTAMDGPRSRRDRRLQRLRSSVEDRRLLQTADRTLGMSNLAFVPRAGNISTDTRAGSPARPGAWRRAWRASPGRIHSLPSDPLPSVGPTRLAAWVSCVLARCGPPDGRLEHRRGRPRAPVPDRPVVEGHHGHHLAHG